jgi:hypothetical protein
MIDLSISVCQVYSYNTIMLLGFHHKYHIYTPGIELWQLCFSLSYGTAIFFFFLFFFWDVTVTIKCGGGFKQKNTNIAF